MVRGQVNIDGSHEVGGTEQIQLFVLGEVTEVDETKSSKSNQDAKRAGVLRNIIRRLGLACAQGIWLSGSGQGGGDMLAGRGQCLHLHVFEGQAVAGLHDKVPAILK